jgi:hypothetical protein
MDVRSFFDPGRSVILSDAGVLGTLCVAQGGLSALGLVGYSVFTGFAIPAASIVILSKIIYQLSESIHSDYSVLLDSGNIQSKRIVSVLLASYLVCRITELCFLIPVPAYITVAGLVGLVWFSFLFFKDLSVISHFEVKEHIHSRVFSDKILTFFYEKKKYLIRIVCNPAAVQQSYIRSSWKAELGSESWRFLSDAEQSIHDVRTIHDNSRDPLLPNFKEAYYPHRYLLMCSDEIPKKFISYIQKVIAKKNNGNDLSEIYIEERNFYTLKYSFSQV